MGSSGKQCVKRKGESKGGEDKEEYMRWYEANNIIRIGRVRQHDELQRDPPTQSHARSPTISQTRIVRTPKRARIEEKPSKGPAKKPRLSIDAPLMIEDSLIKASASHTLDKEQTHKVDANNLDATFADVDDIPIEDLVSV